jgi:hypothetical protein
MKKVYALLDTKSGSLKTVEGHMFHASTDPLKDYLTSGSEWISPRDMKPVVVVMNRLVGGPMPLPDMPLYRRPALTDDPLFMVALPEDL